MQLGWQKRIRLKGGRNLGDFAFYALAAAVAAGVLVLVAMYAWEVARQSQLSMLRFGWRFIFSQTWDPVAEEFGALPFIFGTIATSLIALAIAGTLSFGAAAFLSEIAPAWLRVPLSFMIELLASIPSVVYGLWGIFVLAPWLRSTVQPFLKATLGFLPLFQGPAFGVGLLAGGVILAIMIFPTIAAVSRDVLAAVPVAQREAALALGATRWEMIRMAVFPYARSGVLGAAILGLGRALGETMAVTMVIGNRAEISASLFAPAYTMASVIANEFTEATSDLYLSALMEIGLLLLAITLVINVLARLLVWSVVRNAAEGART